MIKKIEAAFAFSLLVLNLSIAGAANPKQGEPSIAIPNEKSAFLRRAAGQPVHWYALGPEALAKANEANKPILIEVGAIWCPFCEAMDRDGYGNAEIADYINRHFVGVRIDYDAEPELAHRLELAQALANLPSGMLLTMFVTPEGKLYEGGGYFPAAPAKYKPSFSEFLHQASEEYSAKSFRIEPRDLRGELKLANRGGK